MANAVRHHFDTLVFGGSNVGLMEAFASASPRSADKSFRLCRDGSSGMVSSTKAQSRSFATILPSESTYV